MVFDMLCYVKVIEFNNEFNIIVCWGGYLIGLIEYKYIKEVGYQLGLWEMNICIGCGFGVMKGFMKGVVIGYVK